MNDVRRQSPILSVGRAPVSAADFGSLSLNPSTFTALRATMKKTLLVLSAAAAFPLLGVNHQAFADAETARGNEASEGRVSPWPIYRPGHSYDLSLNAIQKTLYDGGEDDGGPSVRTASATLMISAAGQVDGSGASLSVKTGPIRSRYSPWASDGVISIIDTDRREPDQSLFGPLARQSFTAKVNPFGEVVSLAGINPIVSAYSARCSSRMSRAWYDRPHLLTLLRATLNDPLAHLPRKSVKVGEKWTITRTRRHLGICFSVPLLLPLEDATECRLLKVEDAPQRRFAVVGFSGRLGTTFTKTGETRIRLGDQVSISQKTVWTRNREPGWAGGNDFTTEIVIEARLDQREAASTLESDNQSPAPNSGS